MKFLLLSLLTFLTLALAHPNVFSPSLMSRSDLQKRCPPFDPSGTKNIGNGAGTQFIGGQCLSAADCASGCCANPCGICSGLGAQTQAGKTGCGFGGASSGTTGTTSGASTGTISGSAAAESASTAAGNGNTAGTSCTSN